MPNCCYIYRSFFYTFFLLFYFSSLPLLPILISSFGRRRICITFIYKQLSCVGEFINSKISFDTDPRVSVFYLFLLLLFSIFHARQEDSCLREFPISTQRASLIYDDISLIPPPLSLSRIFWNRRLKLLFKKELPNPDGLKLRIANYISPYQQIPSLQTWPCVLVHFPCYVTRRNSTEKFPGNYDFYSKRSID